MHRMTAPAGIAGNAGGVLGGARTRTKPDATWLQITRALLIHPPAPGQPQPIGKLAARGLLEAIAGTEGGEA
jgi:hypothetical protein